MRLGYAAKSSEYHNSREDVGWVESHGGNGSGSGPGGFGGGGGTGWSTRSSSHSSANDYWLKSRIPQCIVDFTEKTESEKEAKEKTESETYHKNVIRRLSMNKGCN